MYFFDRLGCFGTKTAMLQDDGSTITYQELENHALWMSSVIPARAFVFCLCENTIGSAAGYLALLHNRSVPLLLDARIDRILLNDLIGHYEPGYLMMPDSMYEEIREGEDSALTADNWICLGERLGYCVLKARQDHSVSMYEELGLLLTTSGSTGSPKLVRQSYRNIQANAESIRQYLALDESERPVTTLPMHYTYGLSIINSHILAGACILLTNQPIITKGFWDFMKKNGATSFGGVPYTYEMLKRIRFFRMDLPDLHTMTQAGGKLLPELHREFAEYAAKHKKNFIVMYGQTEATARMGYLPAGRALDKVGSMGIPIPGGSFYLTGSEGEVITESDIVGELIYEGDNVTLGYAECREDLTKGDERHGRLETGDMAKRDDDGYYYIVGRRKRFLKLFGNRVNLDEVERMIRHAFPEIDCACSGNDDILRIFVTDETAGAEVRRLVTERTHINQRAVEVRLIEEIPRNDSGKIVYKELPVE